MGAETPTSTPTPNAELDKVMPPRAEGQGGPDSVEFKAEKLSEADYKKKSYGFPKKTPSTQEDRDDIKYAKDTMGNPPEHGARRLIENGDGDGYAVVVYDAVAKTYTLFKSTLKPDQVDAKWTEASKGTEIYPNVLVAGYDDFLLQPEGTVKTVAVQEGGKTKTYVMARLRGGKSQEGVRMSEA